MCKKVLRWKRIFCLEAGYKRLAGKKPSRVQNFLRGEKILAPEKMGASGNLPRKDGGRGLRGGKGKKTRPRGERVGCRGSLWKGLGAVKIGQRGEKTTGLKDVPSDGRADCHYKEAKIGEKRRGQQKKGKTGVKKLSHGKKRKGGFARGESEDTQALEASGRAGVPG